MGVVGFTAMLSGTAILFNLVGDIIRNNIPYTTGLLLFLLRLPGIIVYSFPMATILAVILALGRLASDNETVALRACGVSILRVSAPILAFGFMVSMLTLVFNEWIVPAATFKERDLYLTITHQKRPSIRQNVNITEYDSEGRPQRILNALEARGSSLFKVNIVEYVQGELTQITQASSAEYDPAQGWLFLNGISHRLNASDRSRMLVIEFEKQRLNFQLNPLDLTGREKGSNEMNALELWHYIQFKKRLGENTRQLQMEFHHKFAIPFACLIFALLGCPMAIRHQRTSSALGAGLSLIVIILYYIGISISMGLGLTGSLPAMLAAWLPNIVIGGVGIALLKKAMA
jgi:lipopolysaccharide export system permease protein